MDVGGVMEATKNQHVPEQRTAITDPALIVREAYMGHMVGKDVYRKLGRKMDNLTMRAPWNEALHAILRELYSPEEADLAVMMPYGLSTIDQIERATTYDRTRLQKLLEGLCTKGLIMDLWMHGWVARSYAPGFQG